MIRSVWRTVLNLGWRISDRRRFAADRRAVTAIEYAIIAGVIVVAIVTSIGGIAPALNVIFSKISPKL